MYTDPVIKDVIKRAVRTYFEDSGIESELGKIQPRKYDKKYFDNLGEDMLGTNIETQVEKKKDKK